MSKHSLWLITGEGSHLLIVTNDQGDSAVVISMSEEDTSMAETSEITEETFSPLLVPTATKLV